MENGCKKGVSQKELNGIVRRKSRHAAKRILGWTVQQSKDGYYRCYRKISNRVHCIYIGKNIVLKTAKDKIFKKEKILGLRQV